MTSGQCTIGAAMKLRVWRPSSSVSPSLITLAFSVSFGPKN